MNDDRLHAYVDDRLAEEQRRAFEVALAQDAALAERVAAYRTQNDALHALFDPVLDEPHAHEWPEQTRAAAWRRWGGLAATLALGVACGYLARGWVGASAPPPALARQAALAHAAYVPEVRHPVEVPAAEERHLVAWLSKRLATPIQAPSLADAGYTLLGGRLLPPTHATDPAPVALLMYENAQGRRLTLLVKRASTNADTAFRFADDGGAKVFYWIDGPLGYALAGDVPREELQSIARLVYQQLNR
jgi:anti-sigma factor RsiW